MVLLSPGMFEFAAPPSTGVRWFVRACQETGLPLFPGDHPIEAAFLPWSYSLVVAESGQSRASRISLIRHPCDWLRSVFDQSTSCSESLEENLALARLAKDLIVGLEDDFDRFVVRFLEMPPGTISRIFDSYKADFRMRSEDMPWALVELLESLGVEQKNLDRVIALPLQLNAATKSRWQPELRQRVLEAEVKFCERMDYY